MQHAMPPETHGRDGHAVYEPSYMQQQQHEVPQTTRRQSGAYSPSRQIGYREDYSRAQHASLEGQYQHFYQARNRPSSEPGASQDHLRFSAHVNRFASHDPRMTPVHSNREVSVSVSERIKRFSSINDDTVRRPPPPQNYQQHSSQQYRSDTPNARQQHMQQEQAPRSAPFRQPLGARPESSYHRDQEMAQDHYRSASPDTRQYQKQRQPSPARSYSHATSAEPTFRRGEQRSQSPAQKTPTIATSRSHSRDRIERERRSQSPVSRSSPSRMSETQRAARSLLAKRRQRRIEQEQNTPTESDVNGQIHAAPAPAPVVKKTENRDEGRTDRILREARSRSMSPRTSRYSRKSLATPPPRTDLLNNGTSEKPMRATSHRGSTPERSKQSRGEYQTSTPTTPGRATPRAKNYQSAPHIAVPPQEPVSPMTPGSPVISATSTMQRMPDSPASDQTPPRNSTVKNSGDTITSSETKSTVSTVQELKRQLWDSNEKLHVSVKPSLHSHGYSDRSTKQTTGYYAPEMAGNQGQRVSSLSPNSKHAHGHERTTSSTESPGSDSARFNSKYMQAARVSKSEGYSSPEPSDNACGASSSPQEKMDSAIKPMPRRSRQQRQDHVQHRTEPPLPPVAPGRESSDEDFHSPRRGISPVPSSATHSIERVPSSTGVSTATGEASTAKLVAKLTSVSREDPELALQMIDSILRAESKSCSSGGPGSRPEIQSAIDLASQKETNVVDESAEDDKNDDDESASSSFDDSTSVSSITNPTYQRDEKAHAQAQPTSNFGNPRPSSLNKYSQVRPTSPPEEERGQSSKAKKEKKPPPPATIKVNKSDSDRSNGNKEKSSGKREKKEKSTTPPTRVRGLSPASRHDKRDRYSKQNGTGMDAAAIALKIQGWDEQINKSMEEPPVGMVALDDTPLSPTRTEDTGVTEDLGSIITPTSQKQLPTESRRSHPWDDKRPQSNRKARAIDLSIGTYMNNGFSAADEVMAKAFEPASPWQRRRAAKRETDDREEAAATENGEGTNVNNGNDQDTRSKSRSTAPKASLSNSRIAPNVYDVHRKRRSRSGSRDRRQDSASPPLEMHTPSRRNAQPQQEKGNPFDSDYKTTLQSTKSEATNPFDPSYTNPFSSSKSEVGAPFKSAYKRRPNGSKSHAGNVFDSAWVALPADAFPGAIQESRGLSREMPSPAFSDDTAIYGGASGAKDLPPRSPTNPAPFGKEEAPEASRDHNDSGSKPRRYFLRRRSSTPKKDRTLALKQNKPLLSSYAMDSVTDVKDEFNVRRRPSKSQEHRRSRTLSPAPRSVMKSPGRNHLKSRHTSFTDDGEDETSSLTGSLTGSTTSSVRNKNLAKKFSRFLKVYED
mmetsp:Transcript_20446/g.37106  ORF Transcript_20446/g.37106 Transcript_20446/m.37106 type:complete len:1352 (-) Transcript_20446:35-4090(-)